MGRVRIGKYVFYLLLLPLTLGVFGWQGWLWWSWASSSVAAQEEPVADVDSLPDSMVIEIPEGTSAQQIGTLLADAGVIRSANAWDVWTRWQTVQNREGGFLAGTYALSPSQPLDAIANKIWAGEVLTTSFTIPEGWAITQMGQYFEELGWFSAEAFIAATRSVSQDQYSW